MRVSKGVIFPPPPTMVYRPDFSGSMRAASWRIEEVGRMMFDSTESGTSTDAA